MTERYRTKIAVMLLLFREQDGRQQILLQRRANTGFADGMLDCAASGHVEKNESLKAALVREAKEELGIRVALEDVEFATMEHRYWDDIEEPYLNVYFTVKSYEGEPRIAEPEKCTELLWAFWDRLPEDFVADRRMVVQNYLDGISYAEGGWSLLGGDN